MLRLMLKTIKIGIKIALLGYFRTAIWKTIVIFEISTFKFAEI